MKHFGAIGSVVLLIATCGGCSEGSPTAPPPPASEARGTSSVSGIVFTVSSSGRVPVDGARVRVTSGVVRADALTGEDGTYSVSGLPDGSGSITTTKSGYDMSTVVVALRGDGRLDIQITPIERYTLSGVVYEMTSEGRAPLAGVLLHYSELHEDRTTDANGSYSFYVFRGGSPLLVEKDGYRSKLEELSITGDTRFDIELVKR